MQLTILTSRPDSDRFGSKEHDPFLDNYFAGRIKDDGVTHNMFIYKIAGFTRSKRI
jgi:hypothetical protein